MCFTNTKTQDALFTSTHKDSYIEVMLGLISFESLSDSLQLVLILIILALKICSFEEE